MRSISHQFMTLATLIFFTSCAQISPLNSQKNQAPDYSEAKEVSVLEDRPIGTGHSQYQKIVEDFHKEDKENVAGQIRGSSTISKAGEASGKVYFLYGAEHLNLDNYYFDIPVIYNAAVKKWINYFVNKGKDFFVRYSERSGRYAPILGQILEDYGLPRDFIFLAMAESGFHNKAKSWAKAVGPWQFMPYTGRRYGLKIDWYVDERRDPIKASIAASKYLTDLYRNFGSWELAAAGYNAGEGKIARAIKRYKTANFWQIRKGRYLKRETKNYVPKIMALAIIGKNLRSFGFEEIDFHEPLDFDEIKISPNSDLFKVANLLEIPFEELHRLNPEILRWQTPPNIDSYTLRVPVGSKGKWEDCCNGRNVAATEYQRYFMRSNSSISAVAKKFKIPKRVIASLNNVAVNKRMRKGSEVLLPFREGQSRKANMYSDLYEKPSRRARRWRSYRSSIRRAMKRGKKIASPSEYYTVRKGDTLWHVSRKTGVSLDTIIRNNIRLVKKRMIRVGDKLAIR